MTRPKNSIADRLLAAQVAIDNAIADTEIKTAVAEYGYDETRLAQGKTLLDTTNQLQQVQQKEYGDQYQASEALSLAKAGANKEYMKFVKIGRIALKSDYAAFKKLDLMGNRKNTFSGWMGQARQFYLNALEDTAVIEKMAGFGITRPKLDNGKTLLDQAEAANAAQKKEKGEAQQATQERDKAMDNLEEWLSDFIVIARIALEEKPQLLEKLGIVEPS